MADRWSPLLESGKLGAKMKDVEELMAIITDLEFQLDRAIKICAGYRDLNRNLCGLVCMCQMRGLSMLDWKQ